MLDLTKDFDKEKDVFYPAIWKLGQLNNKTYGVPWLGHSMCMIYNKGILDKAGVNAKSINSLDELVNAMKLVEEKTSAKGIGLVGANHNDVSWMVNQFIYGYGSGLVDQTGHKVIINNEKSFKAIDFYKNVLGKHAQETWVNDTGVEVMKYFREEKVAFEIQGPWGITDIEKNGNPFEVGTIDLADMGLYAEVGPMMIGLPTSMSEDKKTAAKDFIQFLISKEAQEKIMDGEYSPEHDTYYPFRIPVRKDLSESLIFEKYKTYYPFVEGLKKPSIDVPVPKWQTIKDKYYAPGLHQVMNNEITIKEFLNEIEKKVMKF